VRNIFCEGEMGGGNARTGRASGGGGGGGGSGSGGRGGGGGGRGGGGAWTMKVFVDFRGQI
jgi:hypothetical protein